MRMRLVVQIVFVVWPGMSYANLDEPMSTAVDAAVSQGFAGVVGVSDARSTLFLQARSALGRTHNISEVWRWASVTKQLTAMMLVQEAAKGTLALDDTLATRLPSFRGPTRDRVTLRMLLQHTSGLPNPDDTPATDSKAFPTFYLRTGPRVGGREDAEGFCAGTEKAAPGAAFSYNNCDYIVLGAVLERITGKDFDSLVRERLSEPLKLRSVGVAGANADPPAMVIGLIDEKTKEPPFRLATFGPSGAIYGTAEDLLAVDRALLTNLLLDKRASEMAWQGNPKLGYVALGAWSFPAKLAGCTGPVKLVERRGEIGGVEVRNLLAPDRARAMVIFADRSDLDFGEIWQGKGLTYLLASAAFCGGPASAIDSQTNRK